jgi:hypothetical protein
MAMEWSPGFVKLGHMLKKTWLARARTNAHTHKKHSNIIKVLLLIFCLSREESRLKIERSKLTQALVLLTSLNLKPHMIFTISISKCMLINKWIVLNRRSSIDKRIQFPPKHTEGATCPIHTTGDQLQHSSYRAITLPNTVYKTFLNT